MFLFSDNLRVAGKYVLNSWQQDQPQQDQPQQDQPQQNHIASLNKPKLPPKEFGYVTLKVKDDKPQYLNYNIVGTVDRSGSMQDMCSDKKTKMDHIHHTLKNIVGYLNNESNINSNIHLYGFDHSLITICENEKVNDNFQDNFPTLLNRLTPAGMTNIKLAIDKAATVCKNIQQQNDEQENNSSQTIHLHLTDGNITTGESNPNKIAECVYTENCMNAFMGYGTQHSSTLLQTLAENENSQYHFIDSLENAGMVYGEILHSCIYEQIKSIKLNVSNGLIYDYKTNTWNTELAVPSMAADQTRTWHIKANDPAVEPTVDIIYQNSGDTENIEQQYTPVKSDDQYQDLDQERLEICWLRQLTQELMYEGQQIIKEKHNHIYTNNTNTYYDTQKAHSILDYAKINKWDVVWVLINVEKPEMQTKLLNALPNPRRFNLLHHAIHQNNLEQVFMLLSKKVKLTPTRDNISVYELARGKPRIVDILTDYK